MAETWLDAMIENIRIKDAEVTNLKRAANTFFRAAGEEPPYPEADADNPDVTGPMRLRPDEFYGKGFATAARAFLVRRKQAVEAEEVVRGLELGGFDFEGQGWKEADRLRIVSMSMAKNTAQFHRLPNGLFGLREWYPDVIERKKGKKAESEKENETVSE